MLRLKNQCPICRQQVADNPGEHIRLQHGESAVKEAILKAKADGYSDTKIGALYGISFKQLEKIITQARGVNISSLKNPRKIKAWQPENFNPQTTTVWSFKSRGNWATHRGSYRGNWSPYIPRNVILRYSRPGDLVLDYFAGSGTTAVEAKLLGRKCLSLDINPEAVKLALENLNFTPPPRRPESPVIYEPQVRIGDARDLSELKANSVDLICAHPPYAGIINYSVKIPGDLSHLGLDDFLAQMEKVACESFRVLKPGGKCAILIGDSRLKKQVIPVGFKTIARFLAAGFKLKELVIKRQHNCKSTGFWYQKSIQYNFLLLAHEYLPIFEKPCLDELPPSPSSHEPALRFSIPAANQKEDLSIPNLAKLESTTVWLFPPGELESLVSRNLVSRYAGGGEYCFLSLAGEKFPPKKELDLLLVSTAFFNSNPSPARLAGFLKKLNKLSESVKPGGFLAIQAGDFRIGGYIKAPVMAVIETITSPHLKLKEIVIVAPENGDSRTLADELKIVHWYLLVYQVD